MTRRQKLNVGLSIEDVGNRSMFETTEPRPSTATALALVVLKCGQFRFSPLCLSEETLKAVGPFHLVSDTLPMTGGVKDSTLGNGKNLSWNRLIRHDRR